VENKYLKYLLIIGTLTVWVIVILRVVNGMHSSQNSVKYTMPYQSPNVILEEDTFSLLVDYSDPFITEVDSSLSIEAKNIDLKKPINQGDSIHHKPNYDFIKYVGIISGISKKSRIAIVNFKGTDMMMKEKEKIEDFTLIKITKNSLTFHFKGAAISVTRQ
jgi:hypothetical protein